MGNTPAHVIEELARVRESGATNMLDRKRVTALVSPNAAAWLSKVSDTEYMDALNDMGESLLDDFLEFDDRDGDDEEEGDDTY